MTTGEQRAAQRRKDPGEITRLLQDLSSAPPGDRRRVLDQLVPIVYQELKSLARRQRYRWAGGIGPGRAHGTTSLVHEAYSKLAIRREDQFAHRGQFFGLAASTMRSILIDNARWHRREKRGGGVPDLPLAEWQLVSAARSEELLALEESLVALESEAPELARVIECRCFAGLTIEETAEALRISSATVKRRWDLARASLYRSLAASSPPGP